MGGGLASTAKIVCGTDNPVTEKIVPDAIDVDARRQRILVIRDPLSQLFTTASLGIDLRLGPILDCSQKPARYRVTQLMCIAAHRHAGILRKVHILGGVNFRQPWTHILGECKSLPICSHTASLPHIRQALFKGFDLSCTLWSLFFQ